jgi:hypothetical protein
VIGHVRVRVVISGRGGSGLVIGEPAGAVGGFLLDADGEVGFLAEVEALGDLAEAEGLGVVGGAVDGLVAVEARAGGGVSEVGVGQTAMFT